MPRQNNTSTVKKTVPRIILKSKVGNNYFGLTLRELRMQKNITQGQAAELLGISQGQWSGYESGNSRPTLDAIIAIAKKFEIEPLVLVGKSLDKFKFPGEPAKELSFTEYEKISQDIIEDYRANRLDQLRLPKIPV